MYFLFFLPPAWECRTLSEYSFSGKWQIFIRWQYWYVRQSNASSTVITKYTYRWTNIHINPSNKHITISAKQNSTATTTAVNTTNDNRTTQSWNGLCFTWSRRKTAGTFHKCSLWSKYVICYYIGLLTTFSMFYSILLIKTNRKFIRVQKKTHVQWNPHFLNLQNWSRNREFEESKRCQFTVHCVWFHDANSREMSFGSSFQNVREIKCFCQNKHFTVYLLLPGPILIIYVIHFRCLCSG